jgi:glucose/mannose-6-phosphate isomerase
MLMKEHIAGFTKHIVDAMKIGEGFSPKNKREIRNVLVTGLGGSGIGGTIIAQICDSELKVPFVVSKDYFIPGFVNEHTLVVASSYSGNTEETLQSLEAAQKKGALICCVTSGGKVLEIAKQHNYDYILIPGGMPPRSAFGYSATQLFYVLQQYGLISTSFSAQLKNAVALMDSEEANIMRDAGTLAEKLVGKIAAIYSTTSYEGVSIRFRQQINENSKMLCWHHVFPEMNHNELVGWTTPDDNIAVVFMRNSDDYTRTQKRMDLCKEIFKKHTPHVFDIWSKGETQLERSFYLIHFGDWVSWYLSELKNIDCTEVRVIDYLKGELSKL